MKKEILIIISITFLALKGLYAQEFDEKSFKTIVTEISNNSEINTFFYKLDHFNTEYLFIENDSTVNAIFHGLENGIYYKTKNIEISFLRSGELFHYYAVRRHLRFTNLKKKRSYYLLEFRLIENIINVTKIYGIVKFKVVDSGIEVSKVLINI